MKKILLATLLCIGLQSVAQKSDTSRYDRDGNSLTIIMKHHPSDTTHKEKKDNYFGLSKYGHWAGIDFGVAMLVEPGFYINFPEHPFLQNDPARSWTFNFNVFEHHFKIAKHIFGFTTGLGFNVSNYGFRNNNVLNFGKDTITAMIDTTHNYSTNKLTVGYFQIPLLFEFNTNKDVKKNVYFSMGVIAGVRIGSAIKRKAHENNERYVYRQSGTYFLNPFKVDATLRMGYRHWGIFASYNLIPLFDKTATGQANALSFGLSVTF